MGVRKGSGAKLGKSLTCEQAIVGHTYLFTVGSGVASLNVGGEVAGPGAFVYLPELC